MVVSGKMVMDFIIDQFYYLKFDIFFEFDGEEIKKGVYIFLFEKLSDKLLLYDLFVFRDELERKLFLNQ